MWIRIVRSRQAKSNMQKELFSNISTYVHSLRGVLFKNKKIKQKAFIVHGRCGFELNVPENRFVNTISPSKHHQSINDKLTYYVFS